MKKEIYDKNNGLWYTLAEDGMYYPNLTLPDEEIKDIGKYGRMHRRYLENHMKIKFTNLLTSGQLQNYLFEINNQATEMVETLVKQFALSEGCNEQLKASDQMKWVGLMNNYKACAEEIVYNEIVYK
ncbi:MAG: TnpV protein [Clostridia bacterium]